MKNKKFWNWVKNDVTDTPTTRTLYLNGVISSEGWFDDDVTPKMFKDELESGSGDIEVWLDSPGGDVMAATQIYNMLKSYNGKVTVKIHNPLTVAAGNADDMQKAIDMLDEVKESIINAYELKSGLSRAKISHMMDCETWLSAKKAVELGFADSIMFSDTDTDDSYEFSQREVSNRLMNQLIKKNTPTAGVKICDLQTRLNLLK